jgi:hypothetical protein
MPFQVKLALEGLVDRFDGLPQRFEQRRTDALRLALARGTQQAQTRLDQQGFDSAPK